MRFYDNLTITIDKTLIKAKSVLHYLVVKTY